jgi:hypothetical protein
VQLRGGVRARVASGLGAQGQHCRVQAEDAAQLHGGRVPAAARGQAAGHDERHRGRRPHRRPVPAEVHGQLLVPGLRCFQHQGRRQRVHHLELAADRHQEVLLWWAGPLYSSRGIGFAYVSLCSLFSYIHVKQYRVLPSFLFTCRRLVHCQR